jgi:hypothetical protein
MGPDAERCGTKTTYEIQVPTAGMLKLIFEKLSIKERNAFVRLHYMVLRQGLGKKAMNLPFSQKA